MKLHHALVSLLLTATLAGCQSASAPVPRTASLNQEVELAPSEPVAFEEQKLSVEFVRVVEDSRCPTDVTCVWAGEVKVLISTRVASGESVKSEIKSGEAATAGAFRVTVVGVQPEKVSTKKIAPEDYRVTVRVDPS